MPSPRRRICITPPNLMRWLSPSQREKYAVLLDLEPDFLDERVLRLDLNIVFNPIAVRRKRIIEEDYYIGSTGAEIFLEIENGVVQEYTPAQKIDVNYTNSTRRKRISKLELKPTLMSKKKQKDFDLSAGSITFEANQERTFESAFSGNERTLEPIFQHNVVRWLLVLPRGEKTVHDFIVGNLHLFVVCKFSSRIQGTIRIRPSDIRFFDRQRRPLSKRASLLMRYVLHKRGLEVRGDKGILITFEEE